ncbi:MAG: T9SS type A sorting domain-containing protein, partial [Bacteroidota bacterium]
FALERPESYTVVLRSSNGQNIRQQDFPNPFSGQQNVQYDLSGLASGMYLLEVQLVSGRMTKKIIVQ